MGITEKFMRERVKAMLHLLPTATQKAGEELAAKGIALDKMQHVTVMVSKRLGRAAKQLAAS